jgi:DNA-binding transcriptional regulator GbsR (MarR family)
MSGRMLAWLLVCEPAQQTAAQLAAALSASTGSVSSTTRELIRYGLIDRVAYPGDRKDYFVVRPGVWWTLTRQRLLVIHAFRALTESAARSQPDSTPNERLREMAEFYEFIERAMQDGLERWEAERGRPR